MEFSEQVTAFKRYLRIDTFRFRHRRFAGEWSAERPYDVLRRGAAIAILLYDPLRDCVVLIEQFRMPALLAGSSPWQLEPVGGMIDDGESPAQAASPPIAEEGRPGLLRRARPQAAGRGAGRGRGGAPPGPAAGVLSPPGPPGGGSGVRVAVTGGGWMCRGAAGRL